MFIILTIPSPINLFKNLPDCGRHVTSPYQGLFPADSRVRRKEPGYEVEIVSGKFTLIVKLNLTRGGLFVLTPTGILNFMKGAFLYFENAILV